MTSSNFNLRSSTSIGNLTVWSDRSSTRTNSIFSSKFRHAFIVACHNSSDVLPRTLQHLLKIAKPRSIFLADNGSTDDEVFKTRELAKKVSADYKKNFLKVHQQTEDEFDGGEVNVGALKEGSKNLAQFSVLNSLAYFAADIEFVSLLDDDTILPGIYNIYIYNIC